jgi:hypothetical protein
MDFKQIVWLSSYPKSGNTWARLFLDAYFLGELDINEILCSIGDDGISRYQIGDGSPVWSYPVDIQQLTRPMAMLRTVRAYQDAEQPFPLFLKTHQANVVANGIELLPEALTKATIYFVRDPRDVLPSFANHMGSDIDTAISQMTNRYQLLAAAEHRAADFLGAWDAHVEAALAARAHNVLLIRYEDLRADPVAWFTRMLEHAGVEVDAERVKAAVELTRLSNLRQKEAEEGFKEASRKASEPFFNTGKVGKKIPAHAKSKIERAFRKTMKKLGYLEKASGVINLH